VHGEGAIGVSIYMLIENTFIYLIGFAGTGKLTISQAIQKLLPALLVDNHLVLNVVFSLIDPDGVSPLPPKVWENAWKVRHIVLDTVRELSKPGRNFIFTNELVDGSSDDRKLFDEVAVLARDRGAFLFPVVLSISPEELSARVVSPGRKEKFKAIDGESARLKSLKYELFKPPIPHLNLDVTSFSADESAQAILLDLKNRVEV